MLNNESRSAKTGNMYKPDRLLQNDLVIKSADTHFFRVGLCVPTDDCSIKRSFIQKPTFIVAVIMIEICKIIVFSVYKRDISFTFKVYFGDYGELTGLGNFYRLMILSYISTTICSMVIHYCNYKNGVNQTYLLIFKMMAGLVSPKTVGLTDKSQTIWLIRRTRFVFKAALVNNYLFAPALSFTFAFGGYLLIHSSLFDLILFGLPHSIYFSLLVYLMYEIQSYQLIYFYIICVFLKIKLQSINAKLLEKKSKTSIAYIVSQLKAMNSLYKEINEYNSQFWSQYFFLFWLNIGSLISIDLYVIFLSNSDFLIKICVFYSLVSFFCLFLFVVFTASSVNYEAKKSYKILNHLYVLLFARESKSSDQSFIFLRRPWIIKVNYTNFLYSLESTNFK